MAFEDNERGVALSEDWELFSDDGTGGYNINGYVEPKTATRNPGIPQYGAPHPDYPAALVVGSRVIQIHANWSVRLLISYRSYGLYSGGPRSATASYGEAMPVSVPVYQRLSVSPTVSWYVKRVFTWQRQHTVRIETRWIPGNQVTAVQQAIARSMGGWYNIDGDFYLLAGRTSVSYDGRTFTRANYAFESWSKFPGAGAGDPVLKNSIAIPSLGTLEQWQESYPGDDPRAAPAINVVPVASFASQGLALPGFP